MEDTIILKTLITNKGHRAFYESCVKDGVNINEIIQFNDKFKNHKHLFQENNIDPSDYSIQEKAKEAFFNLNNICDKLIIKSKANKKMRSFFSNKHKDIINEETKELFCDLIELNTSDEFYRGFRKKVAAFKTTKELNDALIKEVEMIKEWNKPENLINKIHSMNTSNISINNGEILFEVHDFKTAEKLGTQMWCICRDETTFIDHQKDVDRIFFKYNFNEYVNNINAMTAYIVNPDSSIKAGYFKDDKEMSKEEELEQNVKFDKYSYSNFKERHEQKGNNIGFTALSAYSHGFEKELKENEVDMDNQLEFQITKEDYKKFTENESNRDVLRSILNDKEILFHSNKIEILSEHMKLLTFSYNKEDVKILKDILNDKDYRNTDEFKNIKLFDILNQNSYLSKDDILEIEKITKTDLKSEYIDYIKNDQWNNIPAYATDVMEDLKVSIIDDLTDKEVKDVISKRFSTIDTLFDGENNPQKVLDKISNQLEGERIIFIHQIKDYAEDRNAYIQRNDDLEIKAIKEDILRRPNTLFVKIKHIENYGVEFDYNDSLTILKKLYLDEDLPFEKYEQDYLLQDALEAKFNKKTEDFVLNSPKINQKAKLDFFETIRNVGQKHATPDEVKAYKEKFEDQFYEAILKKKRRLGGMKPF